MTTHPTRKFLVALAACLCLLWAMLSSSLVWSATSQFEGKWQLNLSESDKVSVSYEKGSGAGRAKILQNISMTVMGLPLPTRTRTPSQSSLAPKNPAVLVCNEMIIDVQGDRVQLVYDQQHQETLRRGHYRGRDAKWNKKKIQQKYKTPDRKVTKTWTLRGDGKLLVEVKINPPKDKSRTFSRVFDRATD